MPVTLVAVRRTGKPFRNRRALTWIHSPSMDLHVIGPLASPAERAAVDASSDRRGGWAAAPRRPGIEATPRGAATRPGAALALLPALQAVQERIGWISQPALNYISRRLAVPPAEAYGVATFYALSRRSRGHRSWPMSATTSRADSRARRGSATDLAARRAGGRGGSRRPIGWQRSPVPRACASWRRRRCSRSPARPTHRHRPAAPGRCGRRPGAPRDGTTARARRVAARPRPAMPSAPPAAPDRRRRPDLARRLPGQRRLQGAREGPRDRRRAPSSPRSPRRSSSAAAARRSRRAASGPRWPASPPSRTTSCATPTSPSPAHSRIGCSWRAIRSRSWRR